MRLESHARMHYHTEKELIALLPEPLSHALDSLLAACDGRALSQEGRALSLRYRQAPRQGAPLVGAGALAYAAARMPATYEAVSFALSCLPPIPVRSVIDAGAGPGTAAWAAAVRWPALESLRLWERDAGMAALGRALGTPGVYETLDLSGRLPGEADLVIMAYALNEFGPEAAMELIPRLWACARSALVLVDPGTPEAFRRMLDVRRQLLSLGAHVAAPCPHPSACPLPEGDWCHFARRVPRSRLHREIKGGERGFEDEKFTFMIFTRTPVPGPCRILRRPEYHKGFVRLALCTPQGLVHKTVTRSEKAAYRRARDAAWGEGWPDTPSGL